jgi:ribosomal protein L11 methyltransferase
MNYIEVNFKIEPVNPGAEILIAQLSLIGYESFEETDDGVIAYIQEPFFKLADIQELGLLSMDEFSVSYSQKLVPDENWNKVWESNYDPVLIRDKVYIRAPFHNEMENIAFSILINPKMSFGTAHHETTSNMIELMLDEDMKGASVLDMGCGTGVLAILAEMMGADSVLAIDNDEWAYNNSLENIRNNRCRNINVLLGDASLLGNERFDFVIANINRNVLTENIMVYSKHLKKGGSMLLSGFYETDLGHIEAITQKAGLTMESKKEQNEWLAVKFIK